MKNLLIAVAVISALAGCDTSHVNEDSCRNNIDHSNEFLGRWACSFAVLGGRNGTRLVVVNYYSTTYQL